jgi:hypothetical protein
MYGPYQWYGYHGTRVRTRVRKYSNTGTMVRTNGTVVRTYVHVYRYMLSHNVYVPVPVRTYVPSCYLSQLSDSKSREPSVFCTCVRTKYVRTYTCRRCTIMVLYVRTDSTYVLVPWYGTSGTTMVRTVRTYVLYHGNAMSQLSDWKRAHRTSDGTRVLENQVYVWPYHVTYTCMPYVLYHFGSTMIHVYVPW